MKRQRTESQNFLPPSSNRIGFEDDFSATRKASGNPKYIQLIQETEGEIVYEENGLVLTSRALQCLHDRRGWLNDEVINFFIGKLRRDITKEIWIPNTFFFPALLRGSNLDRWTKKSGVRWEMLRRILIPIHRVNHWAVCSVHIPERRIMYYDSMGRDPPCFKIFVRYLNDKLRIPLNTEWKLKFSGYSKQTNDCDCGLFACVFLSCEVVDLLPTRKWKGNTSCLRTWLQTVIAEPGSVFQ